VIRVLAMRHLEEDRHTRPPEDVEEKVSSLTIWHTCTSAAARRELES